MGYRRFRRQVQNSRFGMQFGGATSIALFVTMSMSILIVEYITFVIWPGMGSCWFFFFLNYSFVKYMICD